MSSSLITAAAVPAPQGDNRTLLDYFEQTYRPLRLGDASAATLHHYRTNIADFSKFLGRPATLADLDDDMIVRMMGEHVRRGNSPATANKFRNMICAIWNYAHRKRHVEVGPDVRPFKQPKRKPQAWSAEQAAHLIKTAYLGEWIKRPFQRVIAGIPANLWWTGLLLLTYDTGARIGAVLQLRITDIDLDTRHLLIPAEFQKQFEDQSFFPTATTCAILRQFADVERELLFPFPYNIATFYNRLDCLLQFAGLPHGRRDKMHRIRRTTATLCELHVGRGSASSYLGHSSPDITRAYIDTSKLPESRIADRLPRPLLIGIEEIDGSIPPEETMLPDRFTAPVPIEHQVAAIILPAEHKRPDAHPLLDADPAELLPEFLQANYKGAVARNRGADCLRRIIATAKFLTLREIDAERAWETLEQEVTAGKIAVFTADQVRATFRRFILWLINQKGIWILARVANGLVRDRERLSRLQASAAMQHPKQTPEPPSPHKLHCITLGAEAAAKCSPQTPLHEFFSRFYSPMRLPKSNAGSLAVYMRSIGTLTSFLRREALLGDLTQEVLQAYSVAQLEKGYKTGTVANRLTMLMAMGSHVSRCGICEFKYSDMELPQQIAEFRAEKIARLREWHEGRG